MEDHADPLVERILADLPQESGTVEAVSDWRDARDREIADERGLSLANLDFLVRERRWEARNEERVRAKRSERAARAAGFEDGFRAGVEAAVALVRREPGALSDPCVPSDLDPVF